MNSSVYSQFSSSVFLSLPPAFCPLFFSGDAGVLAEASLALAETAAGFPGDSARDASAGHQGQQTLDGFWFGKMNLLWLCKSMQLSCGYYLFRKYMVPQIIHFRLGFSTINQPTIWDNVGVFK